MLKCWNIFITRHYPEGLPPLFPSQSSKTNRNLSDKGNGYATSYYNPALRGRYGILNTNFGGKFGGAPERAGTLNGQTGRHPVGHFGQIPVQPVAMGLPEGRLPVSNPQSRPDLSGPGIDVAPR